jgi:hypothetical protein
MAAEVSNATSPTPSVSVVDAAGRPIHSGSICAGGTACAAENVITSEDRRLGDYFTDAVDSRGCLMIATGDTTLVDSITGLASPISHPLFLHQDGGTSLTGQPCAATSSAPASHGKARSKASHHRRQRRHRKRVLSRRPRRQAGFTG